MGRAMAGLFACPIAFSGVFLLFLSGVAVDVVMWIERIVAEL
jgi:hypothetical protein